MSDLERQAAIGRAVERLVSIALSDEALRPGLETLAHRLQNLDGQQDGLVFVAQFRGGFHG